MKKFAKVLALCLALVMVIGCFAACGKEKDPGKEDTTVEVQRDFEFKENFKIGFICLHDDKSTYDLNFLNAAEAAIAELGLTKDQYIIKTNIPEGNECYEAAKDLVGQGCTVIFANSFGHENYMIQAAKEFPNVQFCHATGYQASIEKLPNFHNAFASIYEGRYLAGIAAGMKLNEMIEAGKITAEQAKMGYVGAFTYAEVISGYTSFYLGAKSVCPSVTMDVQFTGSWYDPILEKEAAEALIAKDCVLISQHADSMGAPGACEAAGIPNVSYNGSTIEACPSTFIVSSRIDWTPYFKYIIKCVNTDEAIATDWCGGLKEGSVALTEVNEAVAAKGTVEAIEKAKAELKAGTLKVFDTSKFTVDGKVLEDELVSDGYYHESEKVSAPSFAFNIDGITRLNEDFGD